MTQKLFYNTVSPLLLSILKRLMSAKEFNDFRLVGGTSLSLQLGHRESIDIDLFTDKEYNSVDFKAIDIYLKRSFPFVDTNISENVIGPGKSYFIGESAVNVIKLDLYYTDPFIAPDIKIDSIRLASIGEIVAMKIDIIAREGRKKDFWDLHELLDSYSLEQMLELHKKRYPYSHNRKEILSNLIKFEKADDDFEPLCLRNKYWELIKLDFTELIENKLF